MKRYFSLCIIIVFLICISMFSVRAESISITADASCRPGKTVAIHVSLLDSKTAAFLVQAESADFTFVQTVISDAAKDGYTRSYSIDGKAAFVYTAKIGAAGFSGEAVQLIFKAPNTPGNYTIAVCVSQIYDADGNKMGQDIVQTVTVSVSNAADDTPAAEDYPSETAEQPDEDTSTVDDIFTESELTVDNSMLSSEEQNISDDMVVLSSENKNNFLLGMGSAGLIFAVGIGVYALVSRPKEKEPDKKDGDPPTT